MPPNRRLCFLKPNIALCAHIESKPFFSFKKRKENSKARNSGLVRPYETEAEKDARTVRNEEFHGAGLRVVSCIDERARHLQHAPLQLTH